ncbi:MAG TPA: hypothetical protein ENI48_02355 [Thioploca sp.]|nr:hypothetical protein [Thioploca sp.]
MNSTTLFECEYATCGKGLFEAPRCLNVKRLYYKMKDEVAGKRLTLSFEPASSSSRQVIESYLPEVPEGQQTRTQ